MNEETMKTVFEMSFKINFALSIVFILMGINWHFFKKKKPILKIRELKGLTKNALLKITPPLPFLLLASIQIIFLFFCYKLIETGAKRDFIIGLNLLQLLCWVLIAMVTAVYVFIRFGRNKINNHYLALCLEKEKTFHPGDINHHPRIFDEPWSKKDMKKVIFINPSTNEIFDKCVNRKDYIFLFSLLGSVILVLFIIQALIK